MELTYIFADGLSLYTLWLSLFKDGIWCKALAGVVYPWFTPQRWVQRVPALVGFHVIKNKSALVGLNEYAFFLTLWTTPTKESVLFYDVGFSLDPTVFIALANILVISIWNYLHVLITFFITLCSFEWQSLEYLPLMFCGWLSGPKGKGHCSLWCFELTVYLFFLIILQNAYPVKDNKFSHQHRLDAWLSKKFTEYIRGKQGQVVKKWHKMGNTIMK